MSPLLMPIPMPSVGRPSAAHSLVQIGKYVDHLQCRLDGVIGMVRIVERRAEERHHHVADELVERAAVGEDDVHHPREVFVELIDDRFGVAASR